MAIPLQPRFPIPNRSNQTIRFSKDEDGVIDVGWCDGVFSDGRPFRAEMWAQDQVSMLTIFFSTREMENKSQDELRQFVEAEQVIAFADDSSCYCSSRKYNDAAGNEMWSVNIVVGADEENYLTASVPLFPYSRTGEPDTLFNPVPIKAAHASR